MAEILVTLAAKSIALALVREAKYLFGIKDELQALQRYLECMKEFLQIVDANSNLLKQDVQLRMFTREMRELTFRAEDGIDNYLFEVRFKQFNKSFFSKLASLSSHPFSLHMLKKEIKVIQQEIEDVIRRSADLKMNISTRKKSEGHVAENNFHPADEFVVGIGDDVKRLVKRLTDLEDDFMVLGIVGTVGAGKSTLASQIYRHNKVQSSFSHIAFVSISQQWSRLDLLHRISKEMLGRSKNSSSEMELVRELHDFMIGKRCLVVLDDIWKKEAWDALYPIFPRTQGLKVILTTRIKEVLLYADKKCVLHEPRMLTDDQMWALFSKGAVEGRHGIENDVEFEKLGKIMLRKCHGLPLAVVRLAEILRTKQYLSEWERINVSLGGKILKEKGGFGNRDVEEMLELSYFDLPSHLKSLFLYLAIIPEDKVWTPKQVIEMWIAEGFVEDDQTSRYETLEDKGMQCLSELTQRYIIQVKKKNYQDEVEYLNLPFLMREFCIRKASECQFLENISSTFSYETRTSKSRRVSIFSREHLLEENNFLRTIVYQGLSYKSSDGVLRNLDSIHKDFKLLRVLRISDCANKTLPKAIGNLIHLTYLSVIRTEITELPESVRNLCNLIYLEFYPTFVEGRTAKLPDDLVRNMEHLRVLQLPIRLLKSGSGKCNRLGINSERHKKLDKFRCGAGKWLAKDLPVMHLLPLRDLQITNIDEIEEMQAIHQCLGFFEGSLQQFDCIFGDAGVNKELKFDTSKLMGIQSLHSLCLRGRLVNNYSIQFPANLVSLEISKSEIDKGVDLMGVLGKLSKLRELYIACQAYMGSQLRCTSTSFPQLEVLELNNLDCLEEWIVEEVAMERLKKITIVYCPKLKRLPQGIRSITTLKELIIRSMPEEFCWRLGYKRDENEGPASTVQTQRGEDSYIIEHISYVKLGYIIQTHTSTAQYPDAVFYSDETESPQRTFKSGLSGGDSLSNQNAHLNAHIPPAYIDEKAIQSHYEPTKQVQAGTAHDPATESCSDSNVGDSIAAFNETTVRSGVSGGDSLSNQTERQSPISPDEVTELTPPTTTEISPVWKESQHTRHVVPAAEHLSPTPRVGIENQDDNNNGVNKEEAKRLLFLFGEGYAFERQMLIQLWMALGILADEPMEENGAYYFEKLESEGYILCSVANYLYRVNFEKLGIEDRSYVKLDSTRRSSDSSTETLHVSVVCDEINASIFQTLRGFNKLRTLLFLGGYGSRLQQVPRDLFLCYESLEALDLSGTHIKELPSSARKMINLRYLDLSWTFLEALPERIDHFKKLQTLKLEGCSCLRKLPNETKGLTHLRHLHLDVLRVLDAFPEGMGALVNIRTLSAFPVGTEQGLRISELKYLNHITGSFCIANIENVQSADGAKEAFLKEKKNIKKLNLRWSNHKIEYPMNEAECILQNLCPWSDVEEIQIECYPGMKLPDWIADVSFDKLVSITLFGCVNVNMLPSMGKLPSLESLELINMNSVTEMDFKGVTAEYVAFPKLQKLSIDEMLNLETWAEAGEGDYPCIEELSIMDCPKLRQFPSFVYVPILRHLEVSDCNSLALVSDEKLPESLEQLIVEDCPLMEDRCSKDGGQDWHKIQHVPTIWVNQVAI